MKSRKGWIYRELSGEGDPNRANEQFKHLIARGAQGLDVIGDAPTVALLDPDHPYAAYGVGTQGVSLCRALDYEELYADIPVDEVTLSHSLPAHFAIAGLVLAAEKRHINPAVLRGSTIIGPLYGEDYGYATFVPASLRMRCALDAIEYATTVMPRFHPYVEDTYFFSDGGIGPVDEMALGFVEIRTIIRRLIQRGLRIDAFAPRIALLVNCRMDVLREVAKIRASRRLFARMLRDEFGATDPRSWSVNVAVHTSGASLAPQEPINNVVRGSIQAFALALAGVQSMEISTFDEPFRTPSQAAHVVALRTQQIVAEETDAIDALDPLGGSYLIERSTNELESAIWDRLRAIEMDGDPVQLAESGYFRKIFSEGMVEFAGSVDDGTRKVVGVNCYLGDNEAGSLLRDAAEQKLQPIHAHVERIKAWKESRDQAALTRGLDLVRAAVQDEGANTMPAIIGAMKAGASMGEITTVMRREVGPVEDPLASTPTHK